MPDASSASDASASAPSNLFRSAAQARGQACLGGAVLASPRAAGVCIAIVFAVFSALLVTGLGWQLDDTVRVRGVLTRAGGEVLVRAPDHGVVTAVLVQAGEHVESGKPLLGTDASLFGSDGQRPRAVEEAALVRQLEQLNRRLEAARRGAGVEVDGLRAQLSALQVERAHLGDELAVGEQLEAMASRRAQHVERLVADGHLAAVRSEEARSEALVQRQRAAVARRALARLASEEATLAHRLTSRAVQRDADVARYEQEIAALTGRLNALRMASRLTVAPRAGKVAALRVSAGQTVSAGEPVLTLLDESARLIAELTVPANSVGQVRPGQRVRLRYDAFPYQRFGSYEGIVREVSASAIARLPSSGTTQSLINEPVFRVRVEPLEPTVRVAGQPMTLPVGMSLEADLVRDTRPLWMWLFNPILSAWGKIA